MILDRVGALRSERNAVVEFCRGLSAEDWATPSRCAGWTVQDVVAHMGAAFHGTFGPWVVKLMRSNALERGNDADAARRRSWAPEKVFSEYETWSTRFVAIQPLLQHKPASGIPIRLGDMGTYSAYLLTSAMTFDHHVHFRYDLATVLDRPVPSSDPGRMSVVLEWMWAGLPYMAKDDLAWLDLPVNVTLLGDGAGSWTVEPVSAKKNSLQVTPGARADAAATITADADGFPIWATRRQPWRDVSVKIEGDEEYGTRFLDSMRVV
jgi:uncharacterized protein (TIGR03083 family)